MSSLLHSAWSLLRDVPSFTQELLVLGVFFYSFVSWRQCNRRKSKAAPPAESKPVPLKRVEKEAPAQHAKSEAAHAAEQQMLRHLEQREFTRALNLYRSLERDGRDRHFGMELYTAFVQSAIRVGKVDVVERMLRNMKKYELMPPLQFWQTSLKMLSSRKHYSACLSLHSIFGEQLPVDKVVFSCLVNAALEIGAHTRAAVMLETYELADIDSKDHVLFFRTYVALKDVDAAEAIFRKLGGDVTTLMLNLLLLTCANAGQPQRGLDFLREAREMEPAIVDIVSYNTVIKGFSQAGQPRECFQCLREMLASSPGVEPDDITFSTLLDACAGDSDVMGTANEMVITLLAGNKRAADTANLCALFIKGLVRANCLQKALELYEEMKKQQGRYPDIVTYSLLIKGLVDQHDLDKALVLVEDMASAGHRPDDIILTHLLEGCRHAGNHTLGKRLFQEMLLAGVKPSEFTLVTMLKLHGRCGAHREAHELVSSWETNHGPKPSVIHYTCLISGCLRTKNYDQAWAAYELMLSRAVTPDSTAISTLLPGMVAAQKWDQVVELAKLALQVPVSIPTESVNNALHQMMAVGGHGRQIAALQALMHGAGIPITARNVKRMS